jgi:hypothetical protein
MPGEGGKGKGTVTGAKKGSGSPKPKLVAGKTTKALRKKLSRKKEAEKRKSKGVGQ